MTLVNNPNLVAPYVIVKLSPQKFAVVLPTPSSSQHQRQHQHSCLRKSDGRLTTVWVEMPAESGVLLLFRDSNAARLWCEISTIRRQSEGNDAAFKLSQAEEDFMSWCYGHRGPNALKVPHPIYFDALMNREHRGAL